MRPGKRVLGIHQPPLDQPDLLTVKREPVGPADRAHRVRHKEHPPRHGARADRQPHHLVGDMDAVADHAGIGGRIDAGPRHPRRAVQHRRHRVEKMGETAGARREEGAHLLGRGVGMADRHHRAGRRQRRDLFGPHRLGRHRDLDEDPRRPQPRHMGQRRRLEGAHPAGGMGAAPRLAEVRPLDVQAQHARRALHRQRRVNGAGQHLGRVGDDGGQHAHRAEPPVRGGNRPHGAGAGVVVHQRIAAAVHLQVQEPRRQRAVQPLPRRALRHVLGPPQRARSPARHRQRHAAPQARAVEYTLRKQPEVGGFGHGTGSG